MAEMNVLPFIPASAQAPSVVPSTVEIDSSTSVNEPAFNLINRLIVVIMAFVIGASP